MMGTKLKHVNEIIAWANGSVVQRLYDADKWIDESNPTWDEDEVYRIKPEPKPDYVITGQASWRKAMDKFGEIIGGGFAINITFDGETNKPKAVELIK